MTRGLACALLALAAALPACAQRDPAQGWLRTSAPAIALDTGHALEVAGRTYVVVVESRYRLGEPPPFAAHGHDLDAEAVAGRIDLGDPSRVISLRLAPRGDTVYVVGQLEGVRIHDWPSGALRNRFERDGRASNAPTHGVTFSEDGSIAVVATPYARALTFLDTRDDRILARVPLAVPASGAFLVEPKAPGAVGICWVVEAMLPYE